VTNFIFIPGLEGKEWVLNLDQVRMVDQIEMESVRLCFSEHHSVTLTGECAQEVLSIIFKQCVASNGMPMNEYLERVTSEAAGLNERPVREIAQT